MILKAAHWFCVNVSFQTAGPFPGTVKLREGSLKLYLHVARPQQLSWQQTLLALPQQLVWQHTCWHLALVVVVVVVSESIVLIL